MGRVLAFLVLAGLLVACAVTPEPTAVVPTQTPWIIVVTATPGPGEGSVVRVTHTPQGVVATATRSRKPSPTPTERAVVGGGATVQATAEGTAVATPTMERPTSTPLLTVTSTPEPESFKYPAPELLEPPMDQRVTWKGSLVLKWTSVGELAADEYYALEFYRPPQTADMQPYGDYVFLKETEFLWEGAFLAPFHPPEAQGEAVVYWWVRVVRKTGEDENGKPLGTDLSLPSPKRTMILDPKPEGQ